MLLRLLRHLAACFRRRNAPAHTATSTPSSSPEHPPRQPPRSLRLHKRNLTFGRALGDGAQGQVFEATPSRSAKTTLPPSVAVKISATHTMAAAASAVHEAQAHALATGHPHILTLYGTFRSRRRAFIVTELLRGGDLRAAVDEWPDGIPHDDAFNIVVQVARALRHLHARGLSHCDIKPENILLEQKFKTQATNNLKLCDFGLSTPFDVGQRVRVLGGTRAYMAPEVLACHAHDPACSDMYAVGVLFYELLSGVRPFLPEDPAASEEAHLQARASGPAFQEPAWCRVPHATRELVALLLSDDASARPTAAEVEAIPDAAECFDDLLAPLE